MRINKFIAQAGLASRRGADKLIEAGRVRVNGGVLLEPGYDVRPEDQVTVDGKPLSAPEKKVYYALYKPAGYVTTVSDPQGRPTVMDLVADIPERIYPVGRLDLQTSGLLIMTNDGDFARALMHPSSQIGKVYRVLIAGGISKEAVSRLRAGVDIGGFVTSRARVDLLHWDRHASLLEIEIHEGKNRQVRRMFKAVGHPVEQLERISIGSLGLGRLRPGKYRRLNPDEVRRLLGECHG